MAKKKQKIRTSWAGQFADESLNLKNISDINAGTMSIEDETRSSIDHTNKLVADIERMQKERKELEEDPDGYLNRKPIAYSPELGDFNETINSTVEQFNKENMPKVSAYTKNAWAYHGRKMNDFQIGDFQGYIDRTKHWQELSKGVIRSWEIEDRVNQINKEIDQLQSLTMNGQEDVLNVNQKIEDLLYEQQLLIQEHSQLKDTRDAFDSYIPSGIKSRYYDLVSGNAAKGGLSNIFSNNKIFGRTSQLHDEMGDFLRFTAQMYTPGITRERQKEILNTALNVSDDKIKEWQNGIDLNIQDREKYDKVDPYYQQKFDKGGTDFFSVDTWKYGMPGLIAGSTSGMSKILPAMLLGVATGSGSLAARAAYGGIAGISAGIAGFGATYQFNKAAGIAENNAEVAEAYSERIKDYLQSKKGENGTLYDDLIIEGRKKLGIKNATDDQVFEQFRRGSFDTNNVEVNKKLTQLATGIENQFEDDMMATTYGAAFETALEVVPFGRVLKAPRAIRYAALRSQKGRKFMHGETIGRLKEGFVVGSTASPIVGAMYAPVHTLVRPVLNKAGRVGKVVIDNISEATGISKFIPEDTFTRRFLTEPRKKLMKDISGRWLLSSIEEGIEEGKQHIAADKYKLGEYSSDVIKDFSETLLDDMLAGSKSAGLTLALPFEEMLSESDREILKEIKGGFLLGGLQTAAVNVSTQYAPYSSEMSARDAIINTVLADKASKVDALNKGRIYAEAAKSSSSYQHIKDAFNVLKEKNEQEYESTGQYAVGKEYIEEEEKEFERVAKIANDAYTIKQAEAQGIHRGTEEYNNFVAHKALAEQHVKEEADVLNTANQNYKAKNDDIQTAFFNKELERISAALPGEESKEEDESISDEQLLKITNDYIRTRQVAEYVAMLRRKQEIEMGIDNARRSGKTNIEKILQKQLNTLNDRIKVNKTVIAKLTNAQQNTNLDSFEDIERDLINDRTDHDELVDLYRQVLLATDDYNLAKEQYDRIVGTAYLDDKQIDPTTKFNMNEDIDRITFKGGEAKKIMKATQNTINDDNDFMSVVLQDYQDRTNDEGEEIISPEEKKDIEQSAPENNPEQEFKEEVIQASKKEYTAPTSNVMEIGQQRLIIDENVPVQPISKPSEPVSTVQPITTPETTQKPSDDVKTPKQKVVLQELKQISELSKAKVKKVTPEHYLIEVGDELIQMPRVHSVMPKYWRGDGSYKAALQLGNTFDNLARMFFGDANNIAEYEKNKDLFIEHWFNFPTSDDTNNPNSLNKLYRDLYQNKQAFADTIKDLYELAKQYRDLGWELSTDKIVWHSQFESGWVAGETDMLAVDKDGNIHIIDFKTAKGFHPFETFLNDDLYRTTKYAGLLNSLTEEDFTVGPKKSSLSNKAKQIKRKIRESEGINGKPDKNIMLEWSEDRAVIRYADSEYYKVPSRLQSYRTGPKSNEYSDQLTAYAEMIQKRLANVVDLEVIGFRTNYTTDSDTNLQQISVLENSVNGKPFRIKVSFSDDMHNILNNEGPSVEPVTTQNAEAVEAKQNEQSLQQVQNQETKANGKTAPKKSEDSLKKPNEPATQPNEELGYSNLNSTFIKNNPELAKITAEPNFINECIQKGLVELYTDDARSKGHKDVFANITYNGKTYEGIHIWANPKLYDKVKELERTKKDGQKIVATSLKRTAGEIKTREDGKSVSVLDSPLMAGQDLQTIEFTYENGIIGFVNNGDIQAYAGGDLTQPRTIYTYKGSNKPAPADGTIIYIKNPNHKENPNEAIPVGIKRKTFKDSADFIVECLQQINSINDPYVITVNGQTKSTGVTKKQMLSLLIPIINDVRNADGYSIMRDPNNPSIFHIVQRDQTQPVYSVNMLDPQSVENFKNFLSVTDIPLDNNVLVSRIGNNTNKTPQIFRSIKKFFGQNADVSSFVVTPDIKFDRSDILGEGLSGLGWYIKTGRLITNYDGIVAPLVSVGNAGYFEASIQSSQAEVKTIEEQIPKQADDDVIDISFFAPKRLTDKDKYKPKLTVEQIKKNLRPILGDEVDDPTVVKIVTKFATDPRFEDAAIVGLAHKDGLRIYGAAFKGVEYHEAFHRIFELFVDPVIRDKVYSNIAKQLGIDLSEDSSENDWANHRLVAEYAADKYMDYKENNWINTPFEWLNKVLNKIRDIINALFRINDRQLYKIFAEINSGKYRSERRKAVSEEQKKRFETMFKELNYEVHGEQFKHILNDPMYEDAKNTAFYCIMLGQQIDLSGKTVQNTKINRTTFMRGADRLVKLGYDIFGTQVEPETKTIGQLAMSELYSKFEAVSDDIASMFAAVSTDYKKVRQEETQEDLDGDEISIASAWDDNFFKWDYEFSRFDKTSSRVKYFFASIPDMKYNENGGFELQRNSLGMPQMLSMKYVFNEVLSALWDIDTLDELVSRVSDLALTDPMWAVISRNLQNVINGRENNADKEALLTQLMNTIRSNRHTFMIAKAVSDAEGFYTINMQTSDADYNAREYPIQWSQVLSKGGSEVLKINKEGQIVFNPKNPEAAIAFMKISRLFDFSRIEGNTEYVGLKQILSDIPSKYQKVMVMWDVIGTEEYQFLEYSDSEMIQSSPKQKRRYITRKVTDLNDPKQLRKVKEKIVEALNAIGINIHIEEFDYMLRHKYGSTDVDALKQMVNSTDEADSMGSFMYFLNTISNGKTLNIAEDSTILIKYGKRIPFENVYQHLAFVKELGNWKYQYKHSHDELTVLATGGNRFYEMSDNDLFSDTLRSLNKRSEWYENLKKDPYNYSLSEQPDANGEYQTYGSYTLDQLTKNTDLKLQLRHLIGFKTDKRGDEGQDYFEISRREDYLSKVQILESGGILSLTLSDKKKYVYIQGIKLPGLDYSKVLDEDGNILPDVSNAIQKTHSNNDGGIDQLDSVVSQFLSYAKSEYESIKNAGNKNINVANFKEQGKRFSSLLGVWEDTYDKDGNWTGEQFISFNDNKKSWEENLGIAEDYFFDRPEAEQKALIKKNLNKILDKELATAEELGLIQKVGNNQNQYLNYKNKGLNNVAIKSLTNTYMAKYPGCAQEIAESIAVVVYLNDISNKAIMSGQEMERLMSGNPAFYKWKYNDKGELIDRTVDELKRLGGLGSTGTNNFLELPNLPEKYKNGKYRCAEVDNEEIASPQFETLQSTMYEGELRQNIIRDRIKKEESNLREQYNFDVQRVRVDKEITEEQKAAAIIELNKAFRDDLQALREDITAQVDNSSIEDLETSYEGSELLKLSKEKAAVAAKSFAGKIDVADGGAYITDEMCEILLRMEGSWSKEIEEAFDILRGRKKTDYLGKSEAYQKVLTTVIGNQKYTAFGRRMQDGVSVPYYHKMALFPIFECIATGKMSNIFDKMKEQGVDMLLVNSAVKVGSQGSKPINWSDFREDTNEQNPNNFYEDAENGTSWKPTFKESFNFNTYDVDFTYLRKQLNTDPTEEEMLRMGTQAQKIVFSNLFKGRMYKTQSGEQINGNDLQKRIMSSLNALSDIGVKNLNKRFFVTNEDGEVIDVNGDVIFDQNSDDRQLDIEKFAKEVSKLMSDRGADKNIMKALELVSNSSDGKQLSIPLGAISNASWLESVLISMINKEVVDVNTPGAFFIQRSVWAMQGKRMYSQDKGDILGRQIYNGKRLEMINEEGSMDCVLSLDYFEHILPKVESDEYELDSNGDYIYIRDKNGQYKKDKYGNYIAKKKMRDMSFDEARQWLLDNGVIGGKANIMAYRIPTQAESSIHALRCVDVLPVVRDTVILPEEFTKITGSDFDIDKLGLSTINWNVKNGKVVENNEFEVGTQEYYQNQIISDFITLLIDPHTTNILHRSIDNDTKLLTYVVEEIEGKSTTREEPYGFYSLSTQTERKNDYITGKLGIGPFALNNNNHILTMLYDVRFKNLPGSIMSTLGLTDLSGNEDVDGNSIMSWLSALINAHVDIAKDPYISKLNVNPYTYNLVNTLIRTGFGKNTFYFTTQPIMKELATAYMNASSSYMADKNKTQYQLQRDAVQQIAKDKFGQLKIGSYSFDDLLEINEPKNVGMRTYVNDIFKQLVEKDVLRRNANKDYENTVGASVVVNGKDLHLTNEQLQYIIYLVNEQLAPYAQSVSNLVKYSKIDTKKHGKSYTEQQLFREGFNELFFNPDGTGLFEEDGIRSMARESYIQTKTNNAIQMTKNILKGQFLQATRAFDRAIHDILSYIGRSGSKNVDLNNKIAKVIMASIKSEFINEYASGLHPNNPTFIRDLVSESQEEFEAMQAAGHNVISLRSNSKYDLTSYVGGNATIIFNAEKSNKLQPGMRLQGGGIILSVVQNQNDATYIFRFPVIGANNELNEITVPMTRAKDMENGRVILSGGKNTIYDRFNRLTVQLKEDPSYADVLDSAGEPTNILLRSLVRGKVFNYKAPMGNYLQEVQDTYENLKFLKLFNALDQNGVESNYVIDAWDELLHDNKHPLLKEFAEDLVVYAFVTSGDQGGFTKFFKQVPFSWRKESGYGDFIRNKIIEFATKEISQEQLRDAILNNWFDNDFVRTYYFERKASEGKNNIPNFITYSGESSDKGFAPQYHPLILAALTIDEETGVYRPTIDVDSAPMFIKIPRRKEENAKDSQRRYTIYERVDNGMKQAQDGKWISYPIYVKVEPKGNQLNGDGGYLMTEYGRDDSRINERTPNREALSKAYKIGDFLDRQVVDDMKNKFGENWANIIESMNYYNVFADKYKLNMSEFSKALSNPSNNNGQTNKIKFQIYNRSAAEKDTNVLYVFTDNTDRTSGKGIISDDSWYSSRYGKGKSYPSVTSAVVRGLDNARPISTQRWYHDGAKGESGRWNDSDFEEFKKVIDAEIQDIIQEWNTGKYEYIYFPLGSNNGKYFNGIFNGKISQITEQRTPKLFNYLVQKMHELNDYLLEQEYNVKNNSSNQIELTEEEQKEAEEDIKACEGGKV